MAKSNSTGRERDEQRVMSRRALIKWSMAAGAALGVSKSRIFEVLEKSSGKGVAYAAAEAATANKAVFIMAGNGSLAWFTQLWQHPDVMLSGDASQAYHLPGQATLFPGTNNRLAVGPTTPWITPGTQSLLAANKQVTAFTCGKNETHNVNPVSTTDLGSNRLFATAAAIQSSLPSVVPVCSINGVALGTAPGAPSVAGVASADGIVSLFNSAASRAGGLLDSTASTQNADLYQSTYATLAGLNAAAGRSTNIAAYQTAKGAAKFLGTNLASQLAITPADITRYKMDNLPDAVVNVGKALIVSVKAFKLGLTNMVMLPAMNDDPHGAYNDLNNLALVTGGLRDILDGFMADLVATTDANTGQSLADSTIIAIHGDTYKNPNNNAGWPDGTPQNTNVCYVYGCGYLKTGWFGEIDKTGGVTGFDPTTGASTSTYDGTGSAEAAGAAIAFAVARGDQRRVSDFTQTEYDGLVNLAQT